MTEDLPGSRLEREIQADPTAPSAVPEPRHAQSHRRKPKARAFEARQEEMRNRLAHAERLHWYALVVPPQKEFVAQYILHDRGLATFVPFEKKWRKHNRFTKAKVQKSFAVAPRYVFVGIWPGQNVWFDLARLDVIKGVVGLHRKPMVLPTKDMVDLINRYAAGMNAPDVQKFMRSRREFSVGDEVEVIEGPFSGQAVPVEEITGPFAKVALKLFGSTFDVQVPLDNLQKV